MFFSKPSFSIKQTEIVAAIAIVGYFLWKKYGKKNDSSEVVEPVAEVSTIPTTATEAVQKEAEILME